MFIPLLLIRCHLLYFWLDDNSKNYLRKLEPISKGFFFFRWQAQWVAAVTRRHRTSQRSCKPFFFFFVCLSINGCLRPHFPFLLDSLRHLSGLAPSVSPSSILYCAAMTSSSYQFLSSPQSCFQKLVVIALCFFTPIFFQ